MPLPWNSVLAREVTRVFPARIAMLDTLDPSKASTWVFANRAIVTGIPTNATPTLESAW